MANPNHDIIQTKLTITLTGRPPVSIIKADWPVIASARDDWHDGEVRCQANRERKYRLTVRQHADGRTIVYGVYTYDTTFQGEANAEVRRGVLLASSADVCDAIMIVAATVDEAIKDNDDGTMQRLAHECVANLPAEELI